MKENKKIGKNYYLELPEGYEPYKTFDAKKDKKFIIKMNILAIILAVFSFLLLLIKPLRLEALASDRTKFLITWVIMIVSMIIYIILHELVHGIAYKILTNEKLVFGFTGFVAYCGVPKAFVTKKTGLISLLAPFTVFSIIFLLFYFLTGNVYIQFLAFILFLVHFSGCAGDLFDTFFYIFKTNKDVLMNDDGAKQVFYQKK